MYSVKPLYKPAKDDSEATVPLPKPARGPSVVFLLELLVLTVAIFMTAILASDQPRAGSFSAFTSDLENRYTAVKNSGQIKALNDGSYTNIIFLHHTVGHLFIRAGALRQRFTEAGYSLWDHGYNEFGLHTPEGVAAGYDYFIPEDNTDPGGLAEIFSQTAFSFPVNTYSALLQHEVIIIKSGFAPANDIGSDGELAQYKVFYTTVRESMARHPEKLFILLTTPPLVPANTLPSSAERARNLASWLTSEEFLNNQENLVVFDLYDFLAEDDPASPERNMLRAEYRRSADSYPNRQAMEELAPIFVEFVTQAAANFRDR